MLTRYRSWEPKKRFGFWLMVTSFSLLLLKSCFEIYLQL